MLKIFYRYFLVILFSFFTVAVSAGTKKWNYFSPRAESKKNLAAVNMLHGTPTETELQFTMEGFSQTDVQTPNGLPAGRQGNSLVISSSNLTRILEAGAPDLSKMAFSLAIPEHASMVVEELSSSFVTYQNIEVAPCKGNLYRNTDPSAVPYIYGNAYSQNEFYPGQLVQLQQPYIVRDLRGQTAWIFPFQYNPVTKELRVYNEIHFRIKASGISNINALSRTAPFTKADPSYAAVYRKLFLNNQTLQYTPLEEDGNMLVICYDAFMPAMQPFVDWKNRVGLYTEMVPFSSVGTSASDLKNYIANYYNTNGLTFVLLVGDGSQIPIGSTQYGESDPSLGYILGNDSYAEVVIGRFSAETISDVETQVARTLAYETTPDPSGQWYHKAVCIGSNQGPGDDNEMDYEHERNIRADEFAYTFTEADELYDGTHGGADASGDPDETDLVNALNMGRSVITYTGHGSCGAFSTTGFSTGDVASLTNADMLPYVWAVACVNGQFNGYNCLAEAFMRSTDINGKATGAVATFMSTINQSWDPPMDAQDEFVDLLTEQYPGVNEKRTFGGISVNGCMHMNDQYGSAGDEMTDTWTCFGDPSLAVRTATPLEMIVSHDSYMDETATTFMVNCNTDGAKICVSKNNQIISVKHSLMGLCNFQNISGLMIGDTLDVTATAHNTVPYFGKVVVTSSTGLAEQTAGTNTFSVYPALVHNGNVTVEYTLKQATSPLIDLMDMRGNVVKNISNASASEGTYQYDVDLSGISQGVYFVRMKDAGTVSMKKIVIK
jgi:hypothetical protein